MTVVSQTAPKLRAMSDEDFFQSFADVDVSVPKAKQAKPVEQVNGNAVSSSESKIGRPLKKKEHKKAALLPKNLKNRRMKAEKPLKSKSDRAPGGDCVESLRAYDSEDEAAIQSTLALQDASRKDDLEYWISKHENEAKRNWDLFYKRNEVNFFKDRHYLQRLFKEMNVEHHELEIAAPSGVARRRTFLEVGCGVGNTLFPIMDDYPLFHCYGVDLSPRAIEFIKVVLRRVCWS